jgi:ketosteroid isomerase-like protein
MDFFEKTLVAIEKKIAELFNKKEINSILKFFSDDFEGFSSTQQKRLTSLSQLKKTFLYYLQQGEVHYSIENIKTHIYGETALATFYWKVEIKKGKRKINVQGRASHVFNYTDTWKIVHEHYSKTL